ncbi:bacterioferritin [Pseudomonadota bacterium]
MKTDPKIIKYLNEVLANELVAINQYALHARIYKEWGLTRLAHKESHESRDDRKHAEQLIKRIMLLGGLPDLPDLGKLNIGEDPQDMLECDLALEMAAMLDLNDAIAYAEKVHDYVTRDLFRDIQQKEKEHADWFETQLDLIEKIGNANYSQTQIAG